MFESLRSRGTSKWLSVLLVGGMALSLMAFQAGQSRAGIAPASLEATLLPGESVSEVKTVTVPRIIPKADILFAFDLTGSMGGVVDTAKAKATEIMTQLDSLIADANYGVASFMDYTGSYTSYGYTGPYGDATWGDYPYSLNLPVSADRVAVSAAINSLALANGMDWPESYTRVLYESYADPGIAWRSGARRIMILFGDSVPHDDNIFEGVRSGSYSTGGDPGRDAVMFTADDLDLQATVAAMAENGVILFPVWSASPYLDLWDAWAAQTGGDAVLLDNTADLAAAIQAVVESSAAHVNNLSLQVQPGFESWVTAAPGAYTDLITPAEVTFDLMITVPAGTEPGDYSFTISAIGDGASYGDQSVLIHVPEPAIPATVRAHPRTLNLKNKGEALMVQVDLAEPYLPESIVCESILLNGLIGADCSHHGDGNGNGPGRQFFFSREAVIGIATAGSWDVVITGTLEDGTRFEGMDTITVILP